MLGVLRIFIFFVSQLPQNPRHTPIMFFKLWLGGLWSPALLTPTLSSVTGFRQVWQLRPRRPNLLAWLTRNFRSSITQEFCGRWNVSIKYWILLAPLTFYQSHPRTLILCRPDTGPLQCSVMCMIYIVEQPPKDKDNSFQQQGHLG